MKSKLFSILMLLWKINPLKKNSARLIKKLGIPVKKLYADMRFKGVMKVKLDNKKFHLYNPGFTTIENELFWNGSDGWEKISMRLWKQLAKESNCILDIGANTGVYSLVASTINPDAEVFAFEPVKRTSSLMLKNLELNPNLKIKLIEKAVSNEDGVSIFYDVPTESQYSASLNNEMLSEISNRISYDVEVVQLDNFEELANKKIDLIKLDVEMHEPEAIEGMINLIKKNQPTILIEILNSEIGEKIEKLLSDIEYYCFSIDEENEPQHVPKIKESDFHNLLLIKKENLHLVNLTLNH